MKRIMLNLLLVAALVLAAGCGSKEPAKDPAVADPTPVRTEPSAAPEETPEAAPEETPEATPESAYPVMEAVSLEGRALETGENETIGAQFPAGEWIYNVSDVPGVHFAIFDAETLYTEENKMNINIVVSQPVSGEVTPADMEQLLGQLQQELAAVSGNGMTVDAAEVRLFNDAPIIYTENTTTMTEELVDTYIANSGITDEQLAALGGREALLNIPPAHQIQIYAVVEGKMLVLSGTYYDEASKARLLETMTIVLETADVK